jgi:hypothetical protein
VPITSAAGVFKQEHNFDTISFRTHSPKSVNSACVQDTGVKLTGHQASWGTGGGGVSHIISSKQVHSPNLKDDFNNAAYLNDRMTVRYEH